MTDETIAQKRQQNQPSVPWAGSHVAKLCDRLGVADAATRIGMAPNSIHPMISVGRVRKVNDLAAKAVLAEIDPTSAQARAKRLLVIRVEPGPHLDMLKTMCGSLNIKFMEFTD